MSPINGYPQEVIDVVGFVLGELQLAPKETPRDASLLATIQLRAERFLGISGSALERGAALAMQYYQGARQAREYLAEFGGLVPVGPQASVASFLPEQPNPNTLVGVRVYFERQLQSGAWVGASVVVNVRAGSGVNDVVDAAVQAVLRGDVRTGHASPSGGAARNATIIGLSGYERNGAVTLLLPE